MVGACDVSPGPPLHTSLHSIRRKIRPNGSRTLCEHTRSTELWCRVFHVAMVPRAGPPSDESQPSCRDFVYRSTHYSHYVIIIIQSAVGIRPSPRFDSRSRRRRLSLTWRLRALRVRGYGASGCGSLLKIMQQLAVAIIRPTRPIASLLSSTAPYTPSAPPPTRS